jgi:hypothetical protein
MSHISDESTSISCVMKIKRSEKRKDKKAATPALPPFLTEGSYRLGTVPMSIH